MHRRPCDHQDPAVGLEAFHDSVQQFIVVEVEIMDPVDDLARAWTSPVSMHCDPTPHTLLQIRPWKYDERVNPYLATFSKHGELGRSKSRMGATSSGPLDGAS